MALELGPLTRARARPNSLLRLDESTGTRMAYTFDDALNDSLVTVVRRDDSRGAFEVKIGLLKTIVAIDLGRSMDSNRTKYSVSHSIKTPTQICPCRTAPPFADQPPYALRRAIRGLTDYYRDAIAHGHAPNEEWLVEN